MKGLCRYPEYRDSGVEWLGEIPAHWDVGRLKALTDVQLSSVNEKTVFGQPSVRLCNYTDVCYRDLIRRSHATAFMRATAPESEIERFGLRKGDVLIIKDPETPDDIAVPAMVAEDLPGVVCGYQLAMFRPNSLLCDGRFLGRAIGAAGPSDQFRLHASGVTRLGLTLGTIGDTVVPVPPLPEQRIIADFLDRQTSTIDRLVRKKECLIELLNKKRASLISHAVTRGLDSRAPTKDSGVEWLGEIPSHWEVRRLKDHVDMNALALSDNTDSNYTFDYVDIGCVEQGRLSSMLKTMRFESSPSRARRVVRLGDTLVSMVRTNLKAVWTPPQFERDLIASTGFAVLTPRSDSVAAYVGYFCQSDPFADAVSAASVGIPYPAITETMLGLIPTCVPPLSEQRAIADFLGQQTGAVEALVAKTREAVDRLREYRSSLISAAVTGQVDVAMVSSSP